MDFSPSKLPEVLKKWFCKISSLYRADHFFEPKWPNSGLYVNFYSNNEALVFQYRQKSSKISEGPDFSLNVNLSSNKEVWCRF
jgi:hypothetical protein